MENIVIKENPRASSLGLGTEENGFRSKLPNTYEKVQARIRGGRWLTGLDENAMHINAIKDADAREAERTRVRNLRESLELLVGKDLSGTSKFWDDYFVTIKSDRPYDMNDPYQVIDYNILIASKAVAPSLKDTFHVDYNDARFYVARENEDVSDKVSKGKRYAEAVASLLELVKTPDKAVLIGKYLGLHVSNQTPPDNLWDAFKTKIDMDDKIGFIDKFHIALSKSPEELSTALIMDDAFKYQVIRYRDGLYQRGNITLGREKAEVLKFLTDIKNSGELLSIQEEVETKRKFG